MCFNQVQLVCPNLEKVFQPVCQHVVTISVGELVFHLEGEAVQRKKFLNYVEMHMEI